MYAKAFEMELCSLNMYVQRMIYHLKLNTLFLPTLQILFHLNFEFSQSGKNCTENKVQGLGIYAYLSQLKLPIHTK